MDSEGEYMKSVRPRQTLKHEVASTASSDYSTPIGQPLHWKYLTSPTVDRWGYDQDFGMVMNAFDSALPCPVNADQLAEVAIARMNKTRLPPNYTQWLLEYKADSWHDLVTITIPASQTQIQTQQAQTVVLQTQIVALQQQLQAAQAPAANPQGA
jgi:hypothetical protein